MEAVAMQIFGAMEILGNWLSSQDTFLAFMSMNKNYDISKQHKSNI